MKEFALMPQESRMGRGGTASGAGSRVSPPGVIREDALERQAASLLRRSCGSRLRGSVGRWFR
jgi:hypothetical protein